MTHIRIYQTACPDNDRVLQDLASDGWQPVSFNTVINAHGNVNFYILLVKPVEQPRLLTERKGKRK